MVNAKNIKTRLRYTAARRVSRDASRPRWRFSFFVRSRIQHLETHRMSGSRASSSPSAQAAFRRCVLPINLRQPQPSAVLLLALHWRPLGWRSLAPPPVPRPGPRRAARPAPPRRGRPRLRRPRLASRWLASRVPVRPQSMPLSSGGTTGGSKGGRRPGRRPSLAESSSTGRGWGTPDAAVMAAARCLALAPPRSGPGALQIAGRAA